MSTTTNTGGPAFPNTYTLEKYQGLTMRDYFAAKAMQAIRSKSMPVAADEVAARAYEQADAMMKARGA